MDSRFRGNDNPKFPLWPERQPQGPAFAGMTTLSSRFRRNDNLRVPLSPE
jgi:hypothetical protein